MNKWSKILLVWIVAWKIVVVRHGLPVERHRRAIFQDKATAEAFIESQSKATGNYYMLTQKK